MSPLIRVIMERSRGLVFSRAELVLWVEGTACRRDGLLKRALAAGEIVRIRRGLYMLAAFYQKEKPDPYAVAQHIYGPSYIGLESALSFHGWIPEAVYSVASVSLKRSRAFETPLGRFDFVRVPQRCLFAGVERHVFPGKNGAAFISSPLKALADLVHARDFAGTPSDLLSSLRIEGDIQASVTAATVEALAGNYSSRRVEHYLKKLLKEIAP